MLPVKMCTLINPDKEKPRCLAGDGLVDEIYMYETAQRERERQREYHTKNLSRL